MIDGNDRYQIGVNFSRLFQMASHRIRIRYAIHLPAVKWQDAVTTRRRAPYADGSAGRLGKAREGPFGSPYSNEIKKTPMLLGHPSDNQLDHFLLGVKQLA
ncbi:MAG TPA: hypothetical protein VKV03_17810, partial [Candidatus Binataceae bacterium]|nr:hypothetical protein [Candidatus Binataceae bacterium]